MHDILTVLNAYAREFDGASIFSDPARKLTKPRFAAETRLLANVIADVPGPIGILAENGVEAVVAQLSGWQAGKMVVPLPWFFSETQLGHIVRDAGLSACVATESMRPRALQLGLDVVAPSDRSRMLGEPRAGGGQIIYTSGSTGRPKGVRLTLDQINASARQLAEVSCASKADRYLSVLPLPLLLETICAICVPLITGASAHFDTITSSFVARGDASLVANSFNAHNPTTSVLVPELLAAWVDELRRSRNRAPHGLRFVAVGGAPVSPALAHAAGVVGIPVFEGYGLSECCSVVSVNTPNARSAGTAGKPLPDLKVEIEDGEIVVEGPTVMAGYLNQPDVAGRWRTGDLGALDNEGNLVVYGRKDNMIVTSFGRNISPEWIEAMITADARISAAAVVGHGEPHLTAVLVASPIGMSWFSTAPRAQVLISLATMCKDAPIHALPRDFILVTREEIAARNLMTANGRWRRETLSSLVAERRSGGPWSGPYQINSNGVSQMSFYDSLLERTAAERNAFLSIPLIRDAIQNGASRELYIDFLTQAYHHVKHTFPELALAASLTKDEAYQDALVEYMEEERGHEKWILEDIRALGGNADIVRDGTPGEACQVLVGYTYFAIQHISPYALLGSVHVLEGMSTALADKAADAVKRSLGVSGDEGFSYLRSHGALDIEHVAFFKNFVSGIIDPADQEVIVETSKIIYRLYGDIFRELESRHPRQRHAA